MLDLFLQHTTFLGQGTGGSIGDMLPNLLIIGGIFVIFYLFMIRPQQKKQKELKLSIANLSKGDKFVSSGGLYCTVVGIKENVITAKIAADVKVEIAKSSVSAVVSKGEVD